MSRNNTSNITINRTLIIREQKWEGKQQYGYFKGKIGEISHEKTWTKLRKGNLERETRSLQIAAQSNAIRTNDIKAKIDKMQQNNKCWLCVDRDEMSYHIISECSKLTKKKEYKDRNNWVKKVINWELCKKFRFDLKPNGLCTTENPSRRMKHIKLSGILRYKQIT